MNFSEKLLLLRRQKGLSQEQLAEMLDVSRQSVSKWEAQQTLPEPNKIILISKIFDVSIDQLLKDDLSVGNDNKVEKMDFEENTPLDNEPHVMFCTQCGKENDIDSAFCGYCGTPFSPLGEVVEEPTSISNEANSILIQPQPVTFPVGFKFKKYCANCRSKIGVFSRTRIANKMYLCGNCLSQCSNLILPYIRSKTIVDVKYDIARMHQYPEFSPTHRYGKLFFDANQELWRALRYPIFRFQDINDFEVVEERETESESYEEARTKTKGGLGGALVGGALFGAAGAIVGSSVSGRKSVTIGSTTMSHTEYLTRLGIRILLNDMDIPSITVDFFRGRILVSRSRKIVEDINNALGFLTIILKNQR